MAEDTSKKSTTIVNSFGKGMAKDFLPSLMPEGYYTDAWNAVLENEEQHSFGIGNEPSNELCAKLPEGHYPRGHHFIEERDWHVIFSSTEGGFSEIGYIDAKKCEYKKIYNDADGCELGFGQRTWIPIEGKTMQPCNDYIIYWAVNDFYYRLNIDDELHCEIETCEDLLLFQCSCAPEVTAATHEKGGVDLQAGAYQFVAQLEDEDGNTTNWFHVGNPVYLGSENNRAGDVSEQAITVRIENFQSNYERVNIGTIKTIGGAITAQVISQEHVSENRPIEFYYVSQDQFVRDLPLAEILNKDPHYIRGEDLIQYDGRLFLYNVRGERNLDYQGRANNINVKYKVGRVPIRYAHLFSGLRHDEVYAASIHFNYCDGRRTRAFHISGPGGTAPGASCVGCEDLNAENTATGVPPTQPDRDLSFTDAEERYVPFEPSNQGHIGDDDLSWPDYSDVQVWADSNGDDECDCFAFDAILDGNNELGTGGAFEANTLDNLLDNFDIDCSCEPGAWQEAWHAFHLFRELCKCENGGLTRRLGVEGPRHPGGLNGGTVTGDTGTRTGDEGREFPATGGGGTGGATGAASGRGAAAGAQSNPGTCASGNCGPDGEDLGVSEKTLGSAFYRDRDGTYRFEPNGTGDSFDFKVPESEIINGGRATASRGAGVPDFGDNASGGSSRSNSPTSSGDNDPPPRREEPKEKNDPPNGTTSLDPNGDHDTTTGGEAPPGEGFIDDQKDSDDPTYKTVSNFFGTSESGNEGSGNAVTIDDCEPQIIYADAECCKVKEIIPCIDSEGELSAWESCETYPLDKKCCPEGDEEYVYEELAGLPIRHLKMPSIAKQPHFVSYSEGVKSYRNLDAHESNNAYARFIWLDFENIELPDEDELDVPLCEHNPYTINLALRDGSNRSVHSSGMIFETYEGEVFDEPMAYPRHSVNSSVTVDRFIERGDGKRNSSTGRAIDNAFIYHSPDTHFDTPPLNIDKMTVDLTVSGKGFQHGLYAADQENGSKYVKKIHRKGRRASINLNAWETRGSAYCVDAAAYAPADEVLDKSDEFGYSLNNLAKESSVYIQTREPLAGDELIAGDGSFDGDVTVNRKFISDARANYVTLKQFRPDQYGRLENMTYYPVYFASKEDANNGTAAVRTGDAFINLFTIKRTSYVSDRVPDDITPDAEITQGIAGIPIIGGVLKRLFVSIGAEKCGCIPRFGQRFDADGNLLPGVRASDPTDPRTRDYAGLTGSTDGYFPQVQTTMVSFITESGVNLGYRGSGDSFEQSTYRDLNGQVIDYTFPGSRNDYEQAWLSRYYSLMVENPKYKMILRMILNAIFTYGIAIYFLIPATFTAARILGDIVGGLTFSLGTAFGLITNLAVIALSLYWMKFWANTDIDNRFFDDVLGIEDCFPDRRYNGFSYLNDSRVGGLEDNWYEYNYDFSRRNIIEPIIGLPPNYLTCECLNEKTYAIPYSFKQNPESYIDAYRNFSTTNFLEIPAHTGEFSKMFKRSNRLYVHTSDMIWGVTPTAERNNSGGDIDTVYINSGGLMVRPIEMYQGPSEGIFGLLDPNAAVNSGFGYIWPDREARKLYMFTGEGAIEAIGSQTMRNWLRENMYFKALEAFPDFDKVDEKERGGIWYSIGIDHRHNRLLFTKIDFSPKQDIDVTLNKDCKSFSCGEREDILLGDPEYFNNVSFTISYDFNAGNFVSFHSYLPQFYMWDRYEMMSWDRDNGTWVHNINGDFQKFYGEYYPFVVEYSAINNKSKGAFNSFEWQNTVLDTETLRWDGSQYVTNTKEHFTDVSMWNSYQATGLKKLDFRDAETEENISNDSVEDFRRIPLEFIMRRWRFNEAFDLLKKKDVAIHLPNGIAPRKVNEDLIENELDNYDSASFIDNHLSTQLTYHDSDKSDVKFLFKAAYTAADNEEI